MSTFETFKTLYTIQAQELSIQKGKLTIDILRTITTNNSKPLFIFDVDYVILNSSENGLKKHLNEGFATYHPALAADTWLTTYPLAKNQENYYDYNFHCEILAEIIEGASYSKKTIENIKERYNHIVDTVIPECIYQNILPFFEYYKDRADFILITSGAGEFQRRKLAAAMEKLHISPLAILYPEKLYKGIVIKKLYAGLIPEVSFANRSVYIFEDNIDELTDIAIENSKHEIHLIRIKQKDGNYNNKISTLDSLQEINGLEEENLLQNLQSLIDS